MSPEDVKKKVSGQEVIEIRVASGEMALDLEVEDPEEFEDVKQFINLASSRTFNKKPFSSETSEKQEDLEEVKQELLNQHSSFFENILHRLEELQEQLSDQKVVGKVNELQDQIEQLREEHLDVEDQIQNLQLHQEGLQSKVEEIEENATGSKESSEKPETDSKNIDEETEVEEDSEEEFECPGCGKVCATAAGLGSHKNSCEELDEIDLSELSGFADKFMAADSMEKKEELVGNQLDEGEQFHIKSKVQELFDEDTNYKDKEYARFANLLSDSNKFNSLSDRGWYRYLGSLGREIGEEQDQEETQLDVDEQQVQRFKDAGKQERKEIIAEELDRLEKFDRGQIFQELFGEGKSSDSHVYKMFSDLLSLSEEFENTDEYGEWRFKGLENTDTDSSSSSCDEQDTSGLVESFDQLRSEKKANQLEKVEKAVKSLQEQDANTNIADVLNVLFNSTPENKDQARKMVENLLQQSSKVSEETNSWGNPYYEYTEPYPEPKPLDDYRRDNGSLKTGNGKWICASCREVFDSSKEAKKHRRENVKEYGNNDYEGDCKDLWIHKRLPEQFLKNGAVDKIVEKSLKGSELADENGVPIKA